MDVKLNSDDTATIWIYEPIGADFFGGVSAKDFADEAMKLKDRDILVRLNSPGGDAFDGVAIHSLMKDRKRNTKVIIDGLAASAASIVAMGGDQIEMRAGSMMMIHEPSVFTFGTASELRGHADVLDQVNDNIVSIYRGRSGMDDATLRAALAAETWYDAEDAVGVGLADEVQEDQPAIAACIDEQFARAAKYRHVPPSIMEHAKPTPPCAREKLARMERQVTLTRRRLLVRG